MAISLLLDPSYITNLAWQLSFASYSGIIFITPLIVCFLYGDKKPGYFANLIIASISAQLFCLPFTLYYFGSVPVLALVANVLVTPAIPFAMLGTFLLGITHLPPLVFLTKQILAFQLAVIDYLAAIPWSSIDFDANNPLVFLSYVPILALQLC
jgi:competence protein ComEC